MLMYPEVVCISYKEGIDNVFVMFAIIFTDLDFLGS